jgi:methylated-DNA-[protein]-cysteine S-methyltransferase
MNKTILTPAATSCFTYYESPIGLIEIESSAGAVTSLVFVDERRSEMLKDDVGDEAVRQIAEYFDGVRREFDVPVNLTGTKFQRRVWEELLNIPFGQTVTYGDVAKAIGKPTAVRAVGAANGQNPVSIIVPCHRVIGSEGRLTGYGGGLWRKQWLLKHEGGLLL